MREGWTYKKLGDTLIFDKRFQGLNGEKQEKIVTFSHVSAEEMKNIVVESGNVRLLSTGNFTGFTTIEKAGASLNKGEVITIPTGGTANIKYYKGLFVDSGNIIGVAINSSIVLRYIYYAMLANNEIINSYYRGASIKHPYMPDIYKLPIPIPPTLEQQQIVSELDLLSSVIEKQKAQIEELDKLAKSIFYDMFGDPVENEKGWEKKRIGDLASIKTGPFGSMLHKDDYISNGIPLVNPMHMKDFHVVADMDFTITEEKANELSNYILQKNDIIFARRGDIGRCAVISEKEEGYLCGTGSLYVRFAGAIAPVYVMYIVRTDSFSQELISKARGATMLNLNSNTIADLCIPLPPLSLQQEFAQKIEAIEAMKSKARQSLKESETLFNSRMDYYFN